LLTHFIVSDDTSHNKLLNGVINSQDPIRTL